MQRNIAGTKSNGTYVHCHVVNQQLHYIIINRIGFFSTVTLCWSCVNVMKYTPQVCKVLQIADSSMGLNISGRVNCHWAGIIENLSLTLMTHRKNVFIHDID